MIKTITPMLARLTFQQKYCPPTLTIKQPVGWKMTVFYVFNGILPVWFTSCLCLFVLAFFVYSILLWSKFKIVTQKSGVIWRYTLCDTRTILVSIVFSIQNSLNAYVEAEANDAEVHFWFFRCAASLCLCIRRITVMDDFWKWKPTQLKRSFKNCHRLRVNHVGGRLALRRIPEFGERRSPRRDQSRFPIDRIIPLLSRRFLTPWLQSHESLRWPQCRH